MATPSLAVATFNSIYFKSFQKERAVHTIQWNTRDYLSCFKSRQFANLILIRPVIMESGVMSSVNAKYREVKFSLIRIPSNLNFSAVVLLFVEPLIRFVKNTL